MSLIWGMNNKWLFTTNLNNRPHDENVQTDLQRADANTWATNACIRMRVYCIINFYDTPDNTHTHNRTRLVIRIWTIDRSYSNMFTH